MEKPKYLLRKTAALGLCSVTLGVLAMSANEAKADTLSNAEQAKSTIVKNKQEEIIPAQKDNQQNIKNIASKQVDKQSTPPKVKL